MTERLPSARLNAMLALSDALVETALLAAKTVPAKRKRSTRTGRGGTLRPGPATPLWNELAAEARRLCTKYGDKANLGRYLALPKQRVHEFLRARSAGPDAERTLMLLIWVEAKRRGITLSALRV